ncbi:MAG: glycosyltransferase family 9 protein [Nevskia sp.]|nr:glycosyltransferase family 9 protein [Nevskia sp.]
MVLANPYAIGDVVMMLPLAGAIRRHWPDVKLHFAGLQLALAQACEFFDSVIYSEDIIADPGLLKRIGTDVFLNPFSCDMMARAAFAARVPIRVGNLFRRRSAVFHNRFVAYGNTGYAHMLGFALRHVKALGVPIDPLPSDPRLLFGLTRVGAAPERLRAQLDPGRFNLILHTKSGGSGREWPLEHYLELARALRDTNDFKLFLTGSEKERQVVERDCPELLRSDLTTDVMGTLSLGELLAFVNVADGLLASGTGPLHIAAALGRHALGIYATGPTLDPTSWRPIGPLARTLCSPGRCRPGSRQCPKKTGPPCSCTRALKPDEVLSRLVMPAFQHGTGELRRRELPGGSIGLVL